MSLTLSKNRLNANNYKMLKKRKMDHINIALKENVQFKNKLTGFEKIELTNISLPEIDYEKIDLNLKFLGKKFFVPLMVTAMTGGCKKSKKINRDIALACEELGMGFGLGSQRIMLTNPDLVDTFFVRDIAPNIFIAGNIGVVQLKNYSIQQIEDMLGAVNADALAIHVNSLQEAIQPGGDLNFSNCIDTIRNFSMNLSLPCYVKEVGAGISEDVAASLSNTKIKAIDVAGAGGTSLAWIEYFRQIEKVPTTFFEYGISTVESLRQVKSVFNRDVIASGGIRTGLDVVKSIGLGAKLAGIALPVLKAQANTGYKGVKKYLETIIKEIRIAMFVCGAKSLVDIPKLY